MSQPVDWLNPTIIVALIGVIAGGLSFFVRGYLEKQRTNRAVVAEIRRLLIVIKRHRAWYASLPETERHQFPLIPFAYVVYKKQVANIGVLKRDIVANAVQFYGYVDFLNMLQRTRADHKHPAAFDKLYLSSLDSCLSQFYSLFDHDLEKMGIPKPSEDTTESGVGGQVSR
jgi:hypothetical protein